MWLRGADNRMLGSLKVFRRMAIFGGVATAHVAALEAGAQMNPFVSQRHALGTHMDLGSHVMTMSEMFANWHWHTSHVV
jgi:hypothetical protein